MFILFLNRYDPLHPRSGGAEVFGREMAKRLVADGHSVTWLSERSGAKSGQDELDGVYILRKGNVITVILHAFNYYLHKRKEIDLVIDEVHAFPFFTRFYVPRRQRVVFVHEVAGDIWRYMTFFPLSWIGMLLEKIMWRFFYNTEKVLTVSESTRQELIALGVKSDSIQVLPEGVSLSANPVKTEKSAKPQLIYFGGLRRLKRVEDQLQAVAQLRKDFPLLKFYILGRTEGKYYEFLRQLSLKLGLQEIVEFTGFVSPERRDELIASSWITTSTSVKEGWGLAVAEAGALGIPAVVYDAAGSRDAVKHMETGLITVENTPEKLAVALRRLFLDDFLREKLGEGAREFNSKLDWNKTYQQFKAEILPE